MEGIFVRDVVGVDEAPPGLRGVDILPHRLCSLLDLLVGLDEQG